MRRNLDQLLHMSRDIQRRPRKYTTAQVAEAALGLASIRTAVAKALEPLKKRLRVDAKATLAKGKLRAVITPYNSHPSESIAVTFPEATPTTRRDADLHALRVAIGPKAFDLYFTTQVTYTLRQAVSAQVAARLKQGMAQEVEALLAVLIHSEPTPRVSFVGGPPYTPNV